MIRIRIRVHESEVWIRESGFAPKFQGSATLLLTIFVLSRDAFSLFGRHAKKVDLRTSEYEPGNVAKLGENFNMEGILVIPRATEIVYFIYGTTARASSRSLKM
jgi:hypothetical protein